jgi:hypothetical protein
MTNIASAGGRSNIPALCPPQLSESTELIAVARVHFEETTYRRPFLDGIQMLIINWKNGIAHREDDVLEISIAVWNILPNRVWQTVILA